MELTNPLFELKEILKTKAAIIKQTKIDLKNAARAGKDYWDFQGKIWKEKREFRHHLIAYCELRGRERKQIEVPAVNNQPNEGYIKQIKEAYEEKFKLWHQQQLVEAN